MTVIPDRIRIEQLELSARIGLLEAERAQPQRLTVTLLLELPRRCDALEDDIGKTIDYFAVCEAVRALSQRSARKLLETLAEEIAAGLLLQFPIRAIDIQLRKYILPDTGFVAVEIRRERSHA
jgi:dihydroneopterin aldolase